MLRPILAFLTLCLAAFLLAPTVASVHERVEELSYDRELPWQIWKWHEEPEPPVFGRPDCDYKDYDLFSEITQWPEKMHKNETYTLVGHVGIEQLDNRGVYDVEVDIYLNETKELPGIHLGKTHTMLDGTFTLSGTLPVDLQANHYHIVAHAKEKRVNCWHLREHWSDPEMDVISPTEIVFDPAERLVVGREDAISGLVRDSAGGPVKAANLSLEVGGKPRTIQTDEAGRFSLPWTPEWAGNVTIVGEYDGNDYYIGTRNETKVRVAEEDFVLDQAGDAGVQLVRSQPQTLTGQVFVSDERRGGNLTLEIEGARFAACDGCDPASRASVAPDDDGRFNVTLVVPANETPGPVKLSFAGAGLKQAYEYDGSLQVQPVLALRADGLGLFSRGYELNATLTDEVGRPLRAPVALLAHETWSENQTGADGSVAVMSSAACGRSSAHAFYNGTETHRPTRASDELLVCSVLAFIPSWLLATPWWVWPLALLALAAAWLAWRSLRERYAQTITSGPPLTLSFTDPRDEAAGYAAVGETVEATAFLESPLPDGHRLRMGTWRAMDERPLDEKLRARFTLTPEALGEMPVRAEILDARGRVVTRRTARLRVVRYAEEIEARYLRLRQQAGASDAVTPREFETWLRRHAPALDADTARRLVRIFEEADYSPRAAGRADFAAYLAAERGVQEVTPDALA